MRPAIGSASLTDGHVVPQHCRKPPDTASTPRDVGARAHRESPLRAIAQPDDCKRQSMAGYTKQRRLRPGEAEGVGGPVVGRGVIGILTDGPRYLLVKRAPGVANGGCWCFPGGHVEAGENSRSAIRRELMEELNIQVEPLLRVGAVRVSHPHYILAVWCVDHVAGDLRPAPEEIAAARWLTPNEVRSAQPSLESTARVMEMLGV